MNSLQPLHRHVEARLIVFVGGRYTERSFDHSAALEPGEFVIRPGFFAHDGISGAAVRYACLRLPPGAARKYFRDYGWNTRRGRISPAVFRELTFDPVSAEIILANTPTSALERSVLKQPMELIAAAITAEEPLPLASVAESHGLRPWELTRLFKRTFGLHPSHYRQEARIQRALRLMAETQTPLARIAGEAGFADQSHLCRALRRATTWTPGQIRRAIALG